MTLTENLPTTIFSVKLMHLCTDHEYPGNLRYLSKFSTICNKIIICSLFIRLRKGFRQNWRLFVVKPVLIFYGVQYAVTGNITTQLWLDRTCRVVFNFNETVCSNLTDERWIEFENKVQAQVNIASETIHLFLPIPKVPFGY